MHCCKMLYVKELLVTFESTMNMCRSKKANLKAAQCDLQSKQQLHAPMGPRRLFHFHHYHRLSSLLQPHCQCRMNREKIRNECVGLQDLLMKDTTMSLHLSISCICLFMFFFLFG